MITGDVTQDKQAAMLARLAAEYAGIGPALHFGSKYQLLVAVILSAQTNDNQVNKITDSLFAEYGTPEKLACLTLPELEEKIKTCGLYKNKAKNILAATRILLDEYAGEVPGEREKLMKLPGVGRKTANVVLAVGFGVPALAVDTHIYRVAHRMGLSCGKGPDDVERDLCALIPEEKWAEAHHWFIWHGRRVCDAKKPRCESCPVGDLCPRLL